MARGRLFFAAPWRGVTIAGTATSRYEAAPDSPVVKPADVDTLPAGLQPRLPARRTDPRRHPPGAPRPAAHGGGRRRRGAAAQDQRHSRSRGRRPARARERGRHALHHGAAHRAARRGARVRGHRPAGAAVHDRRPRRWRAATSGTSRRSSHARRRDDGIDRDAGERLAPLRQRARPGSPARRGRTARRAAVAHLPDPRRRDRLRHARGDGRDAGRRDPAAHRGRRDRASGTPRRSSAPPRSWRSSWAGRRHTSRRKSPTASGSTTCRSLLAAGPSGPAAAASRAAAFAARAPRRRPRAARTRQAGGARCDDGGPPSRTPPEIDDPDGEHGQARPQGDVAAVLLQERQRPLAVPHRQESLRQSNGSRGRARPRSRKSTGSSATHRRG